MKKIILSFSALPVLLLAACSNPADNVPAAQVSASTNSAASAPAGAETRTFAFGPASSIIQFTGSKVTGKHDGGFTNFVGELRVADGKIANTGNKVVIAIDSMWSDSDRLTGHLKSPDFFNAPEFPTSVFETSSVSGSGTNSTVTGNLTLHGVTKQISFPANISVSQDRVTLKAEFFIDRFDFEMKYPGKADDLIRKEVVLKLDVAATPGSADFSPLTKPSAAASAGQ